MVIKYDCQTKYGQWVLHMTFLEKFFTIYNRKYE